MFARLAGIICPLSLVWVMIGGGGGAEAQEPTRRVCRGDKSSGMTRRRTHYLKEAGKAG